MKICVIGAGAIGGSIGGVLSEGGLEVHFNQAGLETTVSSNIVGMMWDKLLINVATGALCGITGLPFGGLRQLEEIKACALDAVCETIAVAKASGVKLSVEDPEAIWTKAHAGLPADFKPSLLQDIEKGARTEIDFIGGSVVRAGERVGVPTPVNRALVAGIKGIELRQQISRGDHVVVDADRGTLRVTKTAQRPA